MIPLRLSPSSLSEVRWYEYLIRSELGGAFARLAGRLGGGLVRAAQDAIRAEGSELGKASGSAISRSRQS